MKKLRRMAGGDTYTIIYLKMQLLSLKNKGLIIFDGVGDDLANELALELDEAVEDMQMTLLFLTRHELIEQLTEAEYLLREAVENMGAESASAERVRQYRERKRLHSQDAPALHCNAGVTGGNKNVTLDKRDKKKTIEFPPTPHGDGEQSSESLVVEMATGAGTPAHLSMTLTADFEAFWNAYPRKQSKGAAERIWQKINPTNELLILMLDAIKAWGSSEQWRRESGRYIPTPANWLKNSGWLDKLPKVATSSSSYDTEMIEALLGNDLEVLK